MSITGILMTILYYTMIGFGFAAGFALFRWVAAKYRKKTGRRQHSQQRWL